MEDSPNIILYRFLGVTQQVSWLTSFAGSTLSAPHLGHVIGVLLI